ncbi:LysR family transcriptional regulator ['Osedax' symbiont bacterium Rs2_46_30_T18]|nr:LysR family transcriptional regulator ['Osedax' symbiont bacterium Rs2_46_30_T18]
MQFDWDDLKIFLSICEHGNLSSASRALKVSQPTVGRRLKALEQSMGTKLFDRLPDGMLLTVHGQQLIPLAQNMEKAASAVHRHQASFCGEIKGTVRISMYEHIAKFLLPQLPALRKKCPDIEIELAIAHNAANLSKREADLIIRECLPDIPDIIAKKLGHHHYAVYGSREYIQGQPQALTGERYQACDWVSYDDEHIRFNGQQWLRKKLGKRLPVIRSNNGVVILDAIIAGAGLGVLPCFVGDMQSDLLKLETIEDVSSDLYLMVHRDMRQSPAVRLMLEALLEVFAEHKGTLHGLEHYSAAVNSQPISPQQFN